MDLASTTTLNTLDLINLSRDIAQINLGYLGISVTILGVLGGVFVYFNIKPLKEGLGKQESKIDEIKSEASDLLEKSSVLTTKSLASFKEDHSKEISSQLQQQAEKLALETSNKIAETENTLIEKIHKVTESEDAKLKTTLLSEMDNKVTTLEKSLTKQINDNRNEFIKETSSLGKRFDAIKSDVKDLKRDIKELQVFKYAKEGKMGSVIISTELLKDSIDDPDDNWRIPNRLGDLQKQIKGVNLEAEYMADIEKQLDRLKDKPEYKILVENVRQEYPKKDSTH